MKHYGFNFNDLFILECLLYKEDADILGLFKIPSLEDFEISQSVQKLKSLEYLTEDPNDTSKIIISERGKLTYEDLSNFSAMSSKVIIIDLRHQDELFEEWWKLYPKSPAWTSNDGKTTFTGSRVLKNLRKPIAKKNYLKLLNQGLKHEELIGALQFEVKQKKLDSIRKNSNQMEYFKGMESYFNQERYLLYIESLRENPTFIHDHEVSSKRQNVTDI